MSNWFSEMSGGAKTGLVSGLVVIVAITAGLAYWVLRPQYAVLVDELSNSEAAGVISFLEENKVDFHMANNGSQVLVAKQGMDQLRVKLAAQGITQKAGVGFEIFDEAEFGMTEYTQRINFQRALQGELSRTLMTFEEVELARVHIVLPESSLFARNQPEPKASVTVVVREGQSLSKKRIQGIQRLVAASVAGMKPSQVTVLDEHGIAVSPMAGDDSGQMVSGTRLEQKEALEKYLTDKAKNILAHAFGPGKAVVQVDVVLNHNRLTRTTENYLPAGNDKGRRVGVLVRDKESSSTKPMAQDEKNSKRATSNTVEHEYRVGRMVEEEHIAPGEIKRLSVAILMPEVKGELKTHLERTVALAVGLDVARGDTIELGFLPTKAQVATDLTQANLTAPMAPAVKTQLAEPPLGQTITVKTWIETLTQPAMAILWGSIALMVVILFALSRKPKQKKMTPEQREVMLRELKEWLEGSERNTAGGSQP